MRDLVPLLLGQVGTDAAGNGMISLREPNRSANGPTLIPFKKREKTEGKYANYFEVGHNAFEFVLDFGQHYAENEEAELCSRIIISPAYARILQSVLTESIEQYEKKYQPIPFAARGEPNRY